MARFLILSLPLLILLHALVSFGLEAFDVARPPELPGPERLGLWVLEAITLVALFLLVRERTLNRWLAGLASGWVAWVLRGPVLVLTVHGSTNLGAEVWWHLSLVWFGLYTVGGLLLAGLAGKVDEEVP